MLPNFAQQNIVLLEVYEIKKERKERKGTDYYGFVSSQGVWGFFVVVVIVEFLLFF